MSNLNLSNLFTDNKLDQFIKDNFYSKIQDIVKISFKITKIEENFNFKGMYYKFERIDTPIDLSFLKKDLKKEFSWSLLFYLVFFKFHPEIITFIQKEDKRTTDENGVSLESITNIPNLKSYCLNYSQKFHQQISDRIFYRNTVRSIENFEVLEKGILSLNQRLYDFTLSKIYYLTLPLNPLKHQQMTQKAEALIRDIMLQRSYKFMEQSLSDFKKYQLSLYVDDDEILGLTETLKFIIINKKTKDIKQIIDTGKHNLSGKTKFLKKITQDVYLSNHGNKLAIWKRYNWTTGYFEDIQLMEIFEVVPIIWSSIVNIDFCPISNQIYIHDSFDNLYIYYYNSNVFQWKPITNYDTNFQFL